MMGLSRADCETQCIDSLKYQEYIAGSRGYAFTISGTFYLAISEQAGTDAAAVSSFIPLT